MDPFYEIQCGRFENIKTYVEAGGDPTIRDQDNNTLLHKILENYSMSSKSIVKLLLDFGANPNAVNNKNCTALDWGPIQYDILELLLQHNYSINHQNTRGSTLLHRMCFDVKMTNLLLSYGADVNIINNDHKRPIDCAREARITKPDELLKIIELLEDADIPDVKEPATL